MISRVGFLVLVCLALLLINVTAEAIGLTVPSDMYEYTITVNDIAPSEGYYFLDPSTWGSPGRGYAMVLNSQGRLVWFAKPPNNDGWYVDFQQFDGYYAYSWDSGGGDKAFIFDSGWNLIDTIPSTHPTLPAYHDLHEVVVNPDGTYWLEWMQYRYVDMSVIVPGGNPNAHVGFHVVELWDSDHNVLWSWDSFDHLDELPFTDLSEPNNLVQPSFEHLHLNSIDECANGDLLLSSRQMSTIHRIDRTTGDVLWNLGGGPGNDFTIIRGEGVPPTYPLDFWNQHDAREVGLNTYSVFDNGNHHSPHRAYARDYVIDEQTWTATLVFAFRRNPAEHPTVQGSHQHTFDGHHLIGWGHDGGISMNASEVDANGNVLFELDFLPDAEVGGNLPGMYRARKYESFTPADAPYICAAMREDISTGYLYCNWFGHEDECSMYDIELGTSPFNFEHFATIYTGKWPVGFPPNGSTWYVRARALNDVGAVISPWSNTWEIHAYNNGLEPGLFQDQAMDSGGNLIAMDRWLCWQELSKDLGGNTVYSNSGTSVSASQPRGFELVTVYPNPFNAMTTVSFVLPEAVDLNVSVYNVAGQLIGTLANGQVQAGRHDFVFDANGLASGLYFVRATVPGGLENTQKVLLVR